MSEQLQLLLRDSKKQVSTAVIESQPTFKDALKLCKSISGLNDQQVCTALKIDPAQWSRIWSDNAHFPDNKLREFMDVCQNIVPLIWLAVKTGYTLQPLRNELEIENESLRQQLIEKEKEIEVIRKWESEKRR